MPRYEVNFRVADANTLEFPDKLLSDGSYTVAVAPDGSIDVSGNKNGLLYLAEVIVRCAIGGYDSGFHVHLPMDSRALGPNLDARPELTLHAPEPD